MRWTIPTLMQRLVNQGVPLIKACMIVDRSYPQTRGDTDYRWAPDDHPEAPALGVYAIWGELRDSRNPLSGTPVDDDARRLAQFGPLCGWDYDKLIYWDGYYDEAVTTVVQKTEQAMRAGDYFEPQAIENDNLMPDRLAELRRSIVQLDGAADYITSIPKPYFG